MKIFRKLTIEKKMALAIMALWICGASLLVVMAYFFTEQKMLDLMQTRVRDYAALGALSVPVVEHASLRQPPDEGADAYLKVVESLRRIRDYSTDIRFVYTLRKGENGGKVTFIGDAEESEADRSHLGDVYEDATPMMKTAIDGLSKAVVEREFYKDQWGTFLSAYAPLYTSDGKFDGILGIDISIANVQKTTRGLVRRLLLFLLLCTIPVVVCAGWLSRRLMTPLSTVGRLLNGIAKGDLTQAVPEYLLHRQDEIGELVQATQRMTEGLCALLRDVGAGVQLMTVSAAELTQISAQTGQSVQTLSDKTATVAAVANDSSTNALSVVAAMEQASGNLSSVADATNQMTATIDRIATDSEKARSISVDAGEQAASVSGIMQQLGAAAREIDQVTETITEISAQTNLLALNATIEAARAGEAGKGFAVVANEIKALAKQTAEATEDIKAKISGVQLSTGQAMDDIEKITGVISEVGHIVSNIATAIEDQAAATHQVAGNIAQASRGVQGVSEHVVQTASASQSMAQDIGDLNVAATKIRRGGEQVHASAAELSKLAIQLNTQVDQFKIGRVEKDPVNHPPATTAPESPSLFIQWSSSYSVGIAEMDNQHRKLIDMINDLHAALKKGAGQSVLGDIFARLLTYVDYHFKLEEQTMAKAKFKGLQAHQKVHQDFVNKVVDMQKRWLDGDFALIHDLMNLLQTWLIEHITRMDKQYGPATLSGIKAAPLR